MTIKYLEDSNDFKRGEVKRVADEFGKLLISKGLAMKVPDRADDQQAKDVLQRAQERDQPKD